MPHQKEIERKFLVKFPKSWEDFAELMDELQDVKRIWQTYLKPEPNKEAARVRKTIEGLSGEEHIVYHFNRKKPVETGVHNEEEREISAKEYQNYLKNPYPGKMEVQKTRFVFNYHEQTFELDVFKGRLKGLAILEIELDDKNDTVELPPFLQVIREVTRDKSLNNFSLADKKYESSRS
jgi:CYTH domain-containing protein